MEEAAGKRLGGYGRLVVPVLAAVAALVPRDRLVEEARLPRPMRFPRRSRSVRHRLSPTRTVVPQCHGRS